MEECSCVGISAILVFMHPLLSLLRCPESKTKLRADGDILISSKGARYPIDRNIPRLLPPVQSPREKTEREKAMRLHELQKGPDYTDIETPSALMDRVRRDDLTLWIDQAIPNIVTVLEVECGTGQMANFLGLVSSRTVIGTDRSFASLQLGQQFKDRSRLHNVHFLQADPAHLPLEEDSVDVLICSNALQNAPDAEVLFRHLLAYVKPGGKIIIGLHNRFAKWPLRVSRMLSKTIRKTTGALPERWHTIDETLEWFDRSHVRFLSSIPAFAGSIEGEEEGPHLFYEHPAGSRLQRLSGQLQWVLTSRRTGGLFVLAGEKQ